MEAFFNVKISPYFTQEWHTVLGINVSIFKWLGSPWTKKMNNKEPKSVSFGILYYPDALVYLELRTAHISPNKFLSYNSHWLNPWY